MVFGGEGHRLGGREVPMKFGDPQAMSKYVSDTGNSLFVMDVWFTMR